MPEASFKITVNVEPETGHEKWNGEGIAGVLVKSADERRYTLTVAYPVNRPDAAVAKDGFRDFAGPDAVEEAAWQYLRKSRNVGLWHQDGTDGAGEVVESYIYRGPDWQTDSGYVVKSGDWMVGIQWNAPGWQLIKEGKIGGVSVQGSALRRKPDPSALADLRS